MRSHPLCPDADELRRFLLGRLEAVQVDRLEQHLAACPACLKEVQALNTNDRLVLAVCSGVRARPRVVYDYEDALMSRLLQLQTPDRYAAAEPLHDADAEPPVIPGYEILGPIGNGGMGVVYQARHLGLRRLVALKTIRRGARADEEQRARFQAEARAVARLQHPHIVPLFEVGEHDGRPFFVMEYLPGGSLARRLAAGSFAPRAAAEMVEALARAVHYAHERGVVHRDLKPANVLLTGEGAAKIGDFGLAKQAETGDGGAGYHTESGAILGTPNYMAPEQAAGGDVGPAADVYALGAILYEMLTGRPPFRAATVLETLDQVRTQEPVPPSRLHTGLPRDLQTICLKCLEKDPVRRYAGAQALAEDLARFRRDEPVQARPVSRTERLRKWVRRQPALAGLAAVSGLSLAGLLLGLWLHTARLSDQVRRAEVNEREAREQRERADASYGQARKVINRMMDRLKDRRLTDVPQATQLRHDLQEEALAFFQSLRKEADNPDPAVRLDVALAYRLTGDIQFVEGRYGPAQENCEHARTLLEGLATAYPDEVEYRVQLANVYYQLANLSIHSGRSDDALPSLGRALALRQELTRACPENAAWQADLAETYDSMAFAHLAKGQQPAVAEANWLRGFAIWEQLVREHPQVAAYGLGLARVCVNLGLFDVGRDCPADAEAKFLKAESILTALVRDHPEDIHNLALLGNVYDISAAVLMKSGRVEAALGRYTESIRRLEDALQLEPRFRTARDRLVGVLAARSLARVLLKRDVEAGEDWRRALEQSSLLQTDQQFVDHGDLCVRSVSLARAGAHALAAAGAEALAARTGVGGDSLYLLAAAWAQGVPAVRADPKLATAERDRLAERHGAQAVALLGRLRAQGYFAVEGRAEKLRTDADFGPLRDRADYQKLLRYIETAERQ